MKTGLNLVLMRDHLTIQTGRNHPTTTADYANPLIKGDHECLSTKPDHDLHLIKDHQGLLLNQEGHDHDHQWNQTDHPVLVNMILIFREDILNMGDRSHVLCWTRSAHYALHDSNRTFNVVAEVNDLRLHHHTNTTCHAVVAHPRSSWTLILVATHHLNVMEVVQ